MTGAYTIEKKKLDALIKALKVKPPVARVGILSAPPRKSGDKISAVTTATIGAWHEFGTSELPKRSFLRMPIAEHLDERMLVAGAFNVETLKTVIQEKRLDEWVKKLGILAEAIVQEAFDTGGFGKWKPSDMSRKKVHQTLVETSQLRRAITSEVTNG